MKRGEIYYIQSTYREEGSEQRADRPAVIVSNDKCNENSEVVEIVYMTTQPKNDLPTHVYIRSSRVPSTVLCEQVCSVGKHRFGDYIGKLTPEEEQAVDTALAISLGLDVCAVQITREPTEEELEAIRESVRLELMGTIERPEEKKPKVAPDEQAVKLKAERDIYKKFSEELLEVLKGGARS